VDALVDLDGELAGRDEDQDADRVAGRRERGVREVAEPIEDDFATSKPEDDIDEDKT
jgi:hypothetical protein